jgi:hypothetical protein
MSQKENSMARENPPKIQAVAKAICTFPDGTTRKLYATSFSTTDMFILSMQPIPVGTNLSVRLWPKGQPALPPLEVRVISTRLDPTDAANSGFVAYIWAIDDATRAAIARARENLGLFEEGLGTRQGIERRASPRVETAIRTFVELGGLRVEVNMSNLSMTGAFLSLSTPPAIGLRIGLRMPLDILDESAPEVISVVAEIVRRVETGPNHGLGIRFVDLQKVVAARIEGLMLQVLSGLGQAT